MNRIITVVLFAVLALTSNACGSLNQPTEQVWQKQTEQGLPVCTQPTLEGALQQTDNEPFECFYAVQEYEGHYLFLLLVRGGGVRGPELPPDTYPRWQVTANEWLEFKNIKLSELKFDGNMKMMPGELAGQYGLGYYVRASL